MPKTKHEWYVWIDLVFLGAAVAVLIDDLKAVRRNNKREGIYKAYAESVPKDTPDVTDVAGNK